MPQITGLDVTCEKTGMIVNLQFSAPFNGVVFSKGHFSNPACRYVRRNSQRKQLEIVVPLSSCGTQTVESNSDRLMIENTIIIQADPMVQDSWDSARKITCDWQSKLEKMVTFSPIPVADLQGVAEIKFAGSGDNVKTRMEIQFGRGPFAAPLEGLTKIGDELSVVVYVQDGGAGYDILVKNCHAYDSKNFKNANKIRLLNEHGCLYRPHQMEYFKRTFDVRSTGADIIAYARMNAFKFPDKMDVYLSCELEMCKGGCDTHCEMDDYPIDIIETLRDEPRSRQLEVGAVPPATTFRPADSFKNSRQSFVKRRRRLPKKFGANKVDDDAAKLLTPPATLSPEILELLEEISLDQEDISERSFKGNSKSLDSLGSSSSTQTQHVTAAIKLGSSQDDQEGISHSSTTEKISKMSFSTLFSGNGDTRGGTHITSNEIPSQIMNNPAKFKPSELLSATIERNSGPFTDQITSLSKGSTGSLTSPRPRSMFPPRLPVAAALQSEPASAPINAKLTNIMVHDITNPLFARSDKNAGDLLQSDLISNSVSQPEPRSSTTTSTPCSNNWWPKVSPLPHPKLNQHSASWAPLIQNAILRLIKSMLVVSCPYPQHPMPTRLFHPQLSSPPPGQWRNCSNICCRETGTSLRKFFSGSLTPANNHPSQH